MQALWNQAKQDLNQVVGVAVADSKAYSIEAHFQFFKSPVLLVIEVSL
jgi:hypothetical protein